MHTVTDGLVLREVMYRDTDKMLTILTRGYGKVSASCPGARSRHSRTKAGTQLLAYSSFTFYESRGRYTVNEAEGIELFTGLRRDLMALSLGSYFAEVMETLSSADACTPDLLSLGLNCLYALSTKKKQRAQIKAAFELRSMLVSGYAPALAECGDHCEDEAGTIQLPGDALQAARYILMSDPKKILSFSADPDVLEVLGAVSERYLLSQVERRFSTLDFYKSMEHM